METASTSDTKTSIVIPKAILHDHPYFSFSEVPKQDGDHQYGSHCVVEFTNFNKSPQFGDGMSPNMMITSVPPASIFEGDSDPDSSDDPHQNLVQLTKADLTRASHMQRDPSLRTSQRENKGKTSKYKDEEVDLFNNRRKSPQKKTLVAKEKVQVKSPKVPTETDQDVNQAVKVTKKAAPRGRKSSKKTETVEEESADEGKPISQVEEVKRNGEEAEASLETKPAKATPGKRGRKGSSKVTKSEEVTEVAPGKSEELEEKPSSPKEKSNTPKEKPGTTLKEKPGTTPKEKPGTTPKEKPGTPKEKPGTTPKEKPGTSPKEKPVTTPKEKPGTTPKEKLSTTPKEKPSTTPKEKPVTTPKEKPGARKEKPAPKTKAQAEKATPQPVVERKTRGRGKQNGKDESDKEEEKKVEESSDEPPTKRRRGSARKEPVQQKEETTEPVTPSKPTGKRATRSQGKTPETSTRRTRRNNSQVHDLAADLESATKESQEKQEEEEPVTDVQETSPNKVTEKLPNKKAKTEPKVKAKKKKKGAEEEGKVEAPIIFTPCDVAAAGGDPWGKAVPMELLVKIFIIVKQDMGLLPFISRVSQVCKLWYEATKHPNLWQRIDLSNDSIKKYKKSFHWLCKNRLQQSVSLNLSGWEGLRHTDIQILTNNAKALESLDLSGCSKLGFESLQMVIDKMDKLHTISLAKTGLQLVQTKPLAYLAEKKGVQLKKIDLSENSLVKFESSLQAFMKHCINLEVLIVNNCMFSTQLLTLPLTKLQNSCPNLRVLLLSQSLFKVADSFAKEQNACKGFKHLEHLNISRSTVGRMSKFRHVTDEVLARFLKNAEGLRTLDVSGCLHVTAKGLSYLPCKALEKLYMSQCKAASQTEFLTVLLNWSNSLTELDLSGNSMEPSHLKQILETCSNLSFVDVNGCRGLPWAMRKGYSGQEVHGLLTELNTLIKDTGTANK